LSEMPLNFRRRNGSKDELLASGENRCRNLMAFCRCHDEHNVRWRLLENLQQCVEGRCRQHVHFVNDEDLVSAPCGGIFGALPELANVIDAGIRGSVDFKNINGFTRRDFLTRITCIARSDRRPLSAIEAFGQYARCGRFSDSSRSREEIRVTDTLHLDRILERLDNWPLADDVLKNLRSKLPSDNLIFHLKRGEQAKGDTASHWLTRYRCFLPDLAGFSGSNCTAPQSLYC